MKNKKTRKSWPKDIVFLVSSPTIAAVVAWIFKLNFLVTTLLFLGVPALYLSLKDPAKVKRNLIFSALFTVLGIYVDYMAEKDLAWSATSSLFSYRVGGVVPIENIVWFFLLTYLVIAFYEHFFDHAAHVLISKHMRLLAALVTIGTVAFVVPLLAHRQQPVISYFYLKLGICLGLIPLVLFLTNFPRYLSIFLKIAPYFLALSLMEEFVGLHNGHWVFPGHHFIGWVSLGSYRFPYEELIFWMVMFSSIVITYFEIFDDNHLKFKRLNH